MITTRHQSLWINGLIRDQRLIYKSVKVLVPQIINSGVEVGSLISTQENYEKYAIRAPGVSTVGHIFLRHWSQKTTTVKQLYTLFLRHISTWAFICSWVAVATGSLQMGQLQVAGVGVSIISSGFRFLFLILNRLCRLALTFWYVCIDGNNNENNYYVILIILRTHFNIIIMIIDASQSWYSDKSSGTTSKNHAKRVCVVEVVSFKLSNGRAR